MHGWRFFGRLLCHPRDRRLRERCRGAPRLAPARIAVAPRSRRPWHDGDLSETLGGVRGALEPTDARGLRSSARDPAAPRGEPGDDDAASSRARGEPLAAHRPLEHTPALRRRPLCRGRCHRALLQRARGRARRDDHDFDAGARSLRRAPRERNVVPPLRRKRNGRRALQRLARGAARDHRRNTSRSIGDAPRNARAGAFSSAGS